MQKNSNNYACANLRMLCLAATRLGVLKNEVVFLGGCAVALFITDPLAPDVRPTNDVDCVVDVLSLSHYHQLAEKLRGCGFKQSLDDDVICRWRYDDLILDVMPTDEKIFGTIFCRDTSERGFSSSTTWALKLRIYRDGASRNCVAAYRRNCRELLR